MIHYLSVNGTNNKVLIRTNDNDKSHINTCSDSPEIRCWQQNHLLAADLPFVFKNIGLYYRLYSMLSISYSVEI